MCDLALIKAKILKLDSVFEIIAEKNEQLKDEKETHRKLFAEYKEQCSRNEKLRDDLDTYKRLFEENSNMYVEAKKMLDKLQPDLNRLRSEHGQCRDRFKEHKSKELALTKELEAEKERCIALRDVMGIANRDTKVCVAVREKELQAVRVERSKLEEENRRLVEANEVLRGVVVECSRRASVREVGLQRRLSERSLEDASVHCETENETELRGKSENLETRVVGLQEELLGGNKSKTFIGFSEKDILFDTDNFSDFKLTSSLIDEDEIFQILNSVTHYPEAVQPIKSRENSPPPVKQRTTPINQPPAKSFTSVQVQTTRTTVTCGSQTVVNSSHKKTQTIRSQNHSERQTLHELNDVMTQTHFELITGGTETNPDRYTCTNSKEINTKLNNLDVDYSDDVSNACTDTLENENETIANSLVDNESVVNDVRESTEVDCDNEETPKMNVDYLDDVSNVCTDSLENGNEIIASVDNAENCNRSNVSGDRAVEFDKEEAQNDLKSLHKTKKSIITSKINRNKNMNIKEVTEYNFEKQSLINDVRKGSNVSNFEEQICEHANNSRENVLNKFEPSTSSKILKRKRTYGNVLKVKKRTSSLRSVQVQTDGTVAAKHAVLRRRSNSRPNVTIKQAITVLKRSKIDITLKGGRLIKYNKQVALRTKDQIQRRMEKNIMDKIISYINENIGINLNLSALRKINFKRSCTESTSGQSDTDSCSRGYARSRPIKFGQRSEFDSGYTSDHDSVEITKSKFIQDVGGDVIRSEFYKRSMTNGSGMNLPFASVNKDDVSSPSLGEKLLQEGGESNIHGGKSVREVMRMDDEFSKEAGEKIASNKDVESISMTSPKRQAELILEKLVERKENCLVEGGVENRTRGKNPENLQTSFDGNDCSDFVDDILKEMKTVPLLLSPVQESHGEICSLNKNPKGVRKRKCAQIATSPDRRVIKLCTPGPSAKSPPNSVNEDGLDSASSEIKTNLKTRSSEVSIKKDDIIDSEIRVNNVKMCPLCGTTINSDDGCCSICVLTKETNECINTLYVKNRESMMELLDRVENFSKDEEIKTGINSPIKLKDEVKNCSKKEETTTTNPKNDVDICRKLETNTSLKVSNRDEINNSNVQSHNKECEIKDVKNNPDESTSSCKERESIQAPAEAVIEDKSATLEPVPTIKDELSHSSPTITFEIGVEKGVMVEANEVVANTPSLEVAKKKKATVGKKYAQKKKSYEPWDAIKNAFKDAVRFKGVEEYTTAALTIFKTIDTGKLLSYLLHEVIEDECEIMKGQSPFEPFLSVTQKTVLGLLLHLERNHDPAIVESFLTVCEHQLLFRENDPLAVEHLIRLYASVCKARNLKCRVRRLIFDGLYFMDNLVFPLIYYTLTSWIQVLHRNGSENEVHDPFVKTLVQVVYTKTANLPEYCLSNLKNLLQVYYRYPKERYNENDLLKEFLERYICTLNAKYAFVILILCKNYSMPWVIQQLALIDELMLIVKEPEIIKGLTELKGKIQTQIGIKKLQ